MRSAPVAGAIACLLIAGAGCDGDARPPNLLLITVDTLRADALGSYGQLRATSPHIDALAAEGVVFEQCAAASPSTLPSHATIFTALHPFTHGARSNAGYVLAPAHLTLAEVLRDAGYATGAEVAAAVLGRHTQMNQGFDHYRDPGSYDSELVHAKHAGRLVRFPYRRADAIARRGAEFLRDHAHHPFFLWLHFFDPHSPYAAPPEFAAQVPDSDYHAEVRHVDHFVGEVLAELGRLGLRENTVLLLTGDHGESLGEHGEASHSFLVYDATMRVPLLLAGPGVESGRRVRSLVRSVDVAPTALALLGLPPLPAAQGVSLRPLVSGGARDLALTAYGESLEPRAMFGSDVLRFVREGRWKYIHKLRPELYDVSSDPAERENRAADRADVARALRGRLAEVLARGPRPRAAAAVPVTWERAEELALLGYTAVATEPLADAPASLELSGPDPADLTGDLTLYLKAQDARRAGEFARASERFGALAERYPASEPFLLGLIESLEHANRAGEALPLLERAVELGMRDPRFYLALAAARERAGLPDEAESVLRAALHLEPCGVRPRIELAALLRRRGRTAQQLSVLEQGVATCPDDADLQNEYAFSLATGPDASRRDGPQAVRVAERAVALTGRASPFHLDTLAAAYAEAGDFSRAVATSREALTRLRAGGAPAPVMAVFERNLAELEAGRPLREP